MIKKVVLAKRAEKEIKKLPFHVIAKLDAWVIDVENRGLEEVRKVPGYHDEPLKGERLGQRSIRLTKAYRAIYEIRNNGEIEFVQIEEVNKHDY